MIKFAIAFHRQDGLSHEQCIAHYRDKHAPLCMRTPGMSDYCRRYLQNDVVHGGRDDHHSGLTVAWFDDPAGLFAHFTVPAYLPIIRPDEMTFSKHEGALLSLGEERVVVPGGEDAQTRVFRFLRAKADGAEMERFRREVYGPALVAEVPGDIGLLGYVQSGRVPVDLPFPPEQVFDGLDEFMFASPDAAQLFVSWEASLADRLGAQDFWEGDKGATLISSATRKIFPVAA